VPYQTFKLARINSALQAFQLGAHISHRLVAHLAILFERAVDDALQFFISVRSGVGERGGVW
jgi:hypothetical protein